MNNPPEGEAFHVMEFKMLKQFLYGAVALAVIGGVAYAENNATNPPAPPADTQAADNAGNPPPPPGDGQGWWGRMRHRHGGRHMQDMMGQGGGDGPGMMGHGGPGMMGQGGPGMMAAMMDHQMFHLQLGNGIEVHVNCGKAEMKDCIASAQPLIDAAKAAAVAQPQTKAQ